MSSFQSVNNSHSWIEVNCRLEYTGAFELGYFGRLVEDGTMGIMDDWLLSENLSFEARATYYVMFDLQIWCSTTKSRSCLLEREQSWKMEKPFVYYIQGA